MATPLSQELKDSAARARASVGRRKKKSYEDYLQRSKRIKKRIKSWELKN